MLTYSYKIAEIQIIPTNYGYDLKVIGVNFLFTKADFPTQQKALNFAQQFIDWMENEV